MATSGVGSTAATDATSIGVLLSMAQATSRGRSIAPIPLSPSGSYAASYQRMHGRPVPSSLRSPSAVLAAGTKGALQSRRAGSATNSKASSRDSSAGRPAAPVPRQVAALSSETPTADVNGMMPLANEPAAAFSRAGDAVFSDQTVAQPHPNAENADDEAPERQSGYEETQPRTESRDDAEIAALKEQVRLLQSDNYQMFLRLLKSETDTATVAVPESASDSRSPSPSPRMTSAAAGAAATPGSARGSQRPTLAQPDAELKAPSRSFASPHAGDVTRADESLAGVDQHQDNFVIGYSAQFAPSSGDNAVLPVTENAKRFQKRMVELADRVASAAVGQRLDVLVRTKRDEAVAAQVKAIEEWPWTSVRGPGGSRIRLPPTSPPTAAVAGCTSVSRDPTAGTDDRHQLLETIAVLSAKLSDSLQSSELAGLQATTLKQAAADLRSLDRKLTLVLGVKAAALQLKCDASTSEAAEARITASKAVVEAEAALKSQRLAHAAARASEAARQDAVATANEAQLRCKQLSIQLDAVQQAVAAGKQETASLQSSLRSLRKSHGEYLIATSARLAAASKQREDASEAIAAAVKEKERALAEASAASKAQRAAIERNRAAEEKLVASQAASKQAADDCALLALKLQQTQKQNESLTASVAAMKQESSRSIALLRRQLISVAVRCASLRKQLNAVNSTCTSEMRKTALAESAMSPLQDKLHSTQAELATVVQQRNLLHSDLRAAQTEMAELRAHLSGSQSRLLSEQSSNAASQLAFESMRRQYRSLCISLAVRSAADRKSLESSTASLAHVQRQVAVLQGQLIAVQSSAAKDGAADVNIQQLRTAQNQVQRERQASAALAAAVSALSNQLGAGASSAAAAQLTHDALVPASLVLERLDQSQAEWSVAPLRALALSVADESARHKYVLSARSPVSAEQLLSEARKQLLQVMGELDGERTARAQSEDKVGALQLEIAWLRSQAAAPDAGPANNAQPAEVIPTEPLAEVAAESAAVVEAATVAVADGNGTGAAAQPGTESTDSLPPAVPEGVNTSASDAAPADTEAVVSHVTDAAVVLVVEQAPQSVPSPAAVPAPDQPIESTVAEVPPLSPAPSKKVRRKSMLSMTSPSLDAAVIDPAPPQQATTAPEAQAAPMEVTPRSTSMDTGAASASSAPAPAASNEGTSAEPAATRQPTATAATVLDPSSHAPAAVDQEDTPRKQKKKDKKEKKEKADTSGDAVQPPATTVAPAPPVLEALASAPGPESASISPSGAAPRVAAASASVLDSYDGMKSHDLKAECQKRGLSTEGKRDELRDRLRASDAAAAVPAAASVSEVAASVAPLTVASSAPAVADSATPTLQPVPASDSSASDRYETMKSDALRAECEQRGLPADGKREDMRQRLRQHDNTAAATASKVSIELATAPTPSATPTALTTAAVTGASVEASGPDRYDSMKSDALKAECEKRGLPTDGKREELRTCLREHDRSTAPAAPRKPALEATAAAAASTPKSVASAATAVPAGQASDRYDDMKSEALRAECETRGILCEGLKREEMRQRLRLHDASKTADAATSTSQAPAPTAAPPSTPSTQSVATANAMDAYDAMKGEQLKAECEKRGLSTDGKREELRQRLRQHDATASSAAVGLDTPKKEKKSKKDKADKDASAAADTTAEPSTAVADKVEKTEKKPKKEKKESRDGLASSSTAASEAHPRVNRGTFDTLSDLTAALDRVGMDRSQMVIGGCHCVCRHACVCSEH